MRNCFSFPSSILLLLCAPLAILGAEPTRAVVGPDGATVRSGPGQKHYTTGELSAGDVVEIYGKYNGGWLAIRPPQGSFSLVRREAFEVTSRTDVARITEDGTACRIGSRTEKVPQPAMQVRLKRDELVELLNHTTADAEASDDGSSCRIAPPAGEFRWISVEDLAADPARHSSDANAKPLLAVWDALPAYGAADSRSTADAPPPGRESHDSSATAKANVGPSDSSGTKSVENDGQPSSSKTATAKADKISTGQATPKSETGWRPKSTPDAPKTSEAAANAPSRDASQPTPGSRAVVDTSQAEFDKIQLDLSLVVAKDIRAWNLLPIQRRLDQLAATTTTHSEVETVKRLRQRVDEFVQLQQKYRAAHGLRASGTEAVLAEPAGGAAPNLGTTSYDGSGWLVPVHSTRRTAPPYALLDAEGDVLHYVSPSPGLNLHRYVRKQIGIFGQRGYIPSLKKPHLTARRIVDLQRHLR